MPSDNALDRAWGVLDEIVDGIHSAMMQGDDEEASFLRAEALGAAKAIACWYPARGLEWVRQEATSRAADR